MRFFKEKLIWFSINLVLQYIKSPFIKKHNRAKFSNEAEIFQGLFKKRNLLKQKKTAFFGQPL